LTYVRTVGGHSLLEGRPNDSESKNPPYENVEASQARCDKANADAKALGIKTRYEVVAE
jgi:hypothetical protein